MQQRPAFARLNLRWNPFGEPLREERLALAVASSRLPRAGRILQFLGAAGHGKTTRLLATQRDHPHAYYHYLAEGEDRLPFRLQRGRAYLIDEAQRLTRRRQRHLLSGKFAVVVASHEDLTPQARVPVDSVLVDTDAEQLDRILRRRIEWARRDDSALPQISSQTLARLLERFGGDVRSIEDHLYDVFQQRGEIDGEM